MRITRDQLRALDAHRCVAEVPACELREYRTAVQTLAANVEREGPLAAVSWLARKSASGASRRLLDHLARAGLPGLAAPSPMAVPRSLASLDLASYRLVTRQMKEWLVWLRRSIEAARPAREDRAADAPESPAGRA